MDFVTVFNVLIGSCFVIGLVYAVLSPKVHDSIVVKSGLVLMALGFMVSTYALANGIDCTDVQTLDRAIALVNFGAITVVCGYLLRTGYGRKKRRRSTDWADLEEATPRRAVGGDVPEA